jgi:hypothetical protein
MRRIAIPVALSCLFTLALAASAQDRKPGLYELTVTTTTVSPAPPTSAPAARTRQVCLTQEMIDKYGAMIPDRLTRICQVGNAVKKPGGMNADIICSGPITGKGTLDITWTDSEHSTGNIHFSGTMQPGDTPIKIEWAAVTKSVYKSPDCGDLKPAAPQP